MTDEKTPRTTEHPEGGGQGAAPSPSGDARSYTWSDDPDVDCPACGREFFVSDAFEVRVGCEEECPHCGAVVEQIDEDLTRRWCWKAKNA